MPSPSEEMESCTYHDATHVHSPIPVDAEEIEAGVDFAEYQHMMRCRDLNCQRCAG